MPRKERDLIARKSYAFRKTPSADLTVQTDKDRSDVAKESTMILPMDGTLSRKYVTIGEFDVEREIPAHLVGLGETPNVHSAGTYTYRGLTFRDSRFLSSLTRVEATPNASGFTGAITADETNDFIASSLLPDNFTILGNPSYRAWPFLKQAADAANRVNLMFEGSSAAGNEEIAMQVPVYDSGDAEATVETVTLPVRTLDDLDVILHHTLGASRAREGSRLVSGVTQTSYLYSLHADAAEANLDANNVAWQRLANSMILSQGEYIRANEQVLQDLMAHLPYFKELDMNGYFQKGFRSGFWNRFSQDELRIMGELLHLGMSLRMGFPVRNRHTSAQAVVVPGATTTTTGGLSVEAGMTDQQFRSFIGASVLGGPADNTANTEAELDTLVATYLNDHGQATDPPMLLGFTTNVYVGTALSTDNMDGARAAEVGLEEVDAVAFAALDSTSNVASRGDGEITSWRIGRNTLCNGNPAILPYFAEAMSLASEGDDGSRVALTPRFYNASVSPFFVHIEESTTGPLRYAAGHAQKGRSRANEGFFACVPGLELSLSPALIEQDVTQPQARDIILEDLWEGLSFLFESDDSLGLGKHWGSMSHVIRALSPDFKSGEIHDFKATDARMSTEKLEALHYFGLRNPVDVRLRNIEVNADRTASYFGGTEDNLPSIYGRGGLIDTANKQRYIDDLDDLALRNYQMTNEFISGQQSVGEAESSVYHRQLTDGTEHTIKTKAIGMSFGSYKWVAPASAYGIILDHLLVSGDMEIYCGHLYTQYMLQMFPRSREEITYEVDTLLADGGVNSMLCFVMGTPSWVPVGSINTWHDLHELYGSDNEADTILEWGSDITITETGENAGFAVADPESIHTYYGARYDGNWGDYLMDLSIINPILVWPEITSRVYKRIQEATSALPYKANVEMRDLIDVNFVKQVTFSTGSPAMQQMLQGMMTYLLSSASGQYRLFPRLVDRQLWNRNLHVRADNYEISEPDLVTLMLPKTVDGGNILNLIASSHILAHELGLSGNSVVTVPITAGSFRTIYRGQVEPDGTEIDYMVTLFNEGYDLVVDVDAVDNSFQSGAVVAHDADLGLTSLIPGMRYYQPLFGDALNSEATKLVLCELAGFARVAGNGGSPIDGLQGFIGNINAALGDVLQLQTYRERGTQIDPTTIINTATTAADGTYSIEHPLLSGNVTVAGNVVTAATIVGRVNVLPQRLVINVDGALEYLNVGDTVAFVGALNQFGLPVLNNINYSMRQIDGNQIYHDRAVQYVRISQDVFDRDHFETSAMLHRNKGQMIVGPCPLVAIYNSKGELVSSLRDSFSTVGSGERISGTSTSKPAASSDVISADDTNTPEPEATQASEAESSGEDDD